MFTQDNFVKWYSNINKNKFGDSYSPHKPLTIIFALTKILKNERWIDFVSEGEQLKALIEHYNNRKSPPNCLQPLWRLCNDSKHLPFWTASPSLPLNAAGDINPGDARANNFKAGFSDEAYAWLEANKPIVQYLIGWIIEDNFSETLTEDILSDLGLDQIQPQLVEPELVTTTITRIRRDPAFPIKIMQAYDYRCCVCHLKFHHKNRPFAMEAAHIKWKARGGECSVGNGLSLCPTHHYTFDKGVWTINMDYEFELNPEVIIDAKNDVYFKRFEGTSITTALLDPKYAPTRENIEWHRKNIFLE